MYYHDLSLGTLACSVCYSEFMCVFKITSAGMMDHTKEVILFLQINEPLLDSLQ